MVVVSPTAVQIVRAIETANRHAEYDMLIISRWGSSLEDLIFFKDERMARAIFASHLPVVSSVYHETDVTIAGFVTEQHWNCCVNCNLNSSLQYCLYQAASSITTHPPANRANGYAA